MIPMREPLESRMRREIDALKEEVRVLREEVARLEVENKGLAALADGFKREMVRLTDAVASLRAMLDDHPTTGFDDDEDDGRIGRPREGVPCDSC
jgi:predicted RNase H-like nuclease (RuvC/YqgF family)